MPPVPPLQRLLHLLHAKDCDCRAPLYHRDPIKLPIIVIPLPLPVYLCPTRIHLGNHRNHTHSNRSWPKAIRYFTPRFSRKFFQAWSSPSPPFDGYGIDNTCTKRNRQPEFFFNGIIGHIRPRGGGYVDSWAEATRLRLPVFQTTGGGTSILTQSMPTTRFGTNMTILIMNRLKMPP